jgi:hypothetical protein
MTLPDPICQWPACACDWACPSYRERLATIEALLEERLAEDDDILIIEEDV